MITAREASRDLATRLRRRAEALAKRRARDIAKEADARNWRDARKLWPDFTQD